jgi:hypothetical protein
LGRVINRISFWEKYEEGSVDTSEIQGTVIERGEHGKNIQGDEVAKCGEKSGTKAIRPRARLLVHEGKRTANLIRREGGA